MVVQPDAALMVDIKRLRMVHWLAITGATSSTTKQRARPASQRNWREHDGVIRGALKLRYGHGISVIEESRGMFTVIIVALGVSTSRPFRRPCTAAVHFFLSAAHTAAALHKKLHITAYIVDVAAATEWRKLCRCANWLCCEGVA